MIITPSLKATYTLYVVAFFLVFLSIFVSVNKTSLHVGTFVILQYTLLSGCMIGAWLFSPSVISNKTFYIFIIIAITARVILIFIDPYTSNDIDRYLFDGKIALEGLDPYRTPHNAPALLDLKTQWQPPQEHEKYTTLYPPGALALFSLAASFGIDYAHTAWKVITTIASIALLLTGAALLKRLNKTRAFSFLALSPILLLEPSEAAHIDIFSALSLCIACYFWFNNKWSYVGVAIGIGALIKLLPVFALVPLWFFARGMLNKCKLLICALGTIVLGYVGAFLMGFVPFGSTQTFFIKWRSGSPIFNSFAHFFKGEALLSVLFISGAILMTAVIFFAYILNQTHKQAPQKNILNNTNVLLLQAAISAPLLLTPVIFPWYLAPLCFLIALRPSVFLIVWTLALPLVYEVLNTFICCGVWKNATWPLVVLSMGFITVSALAILPFTRQKFDTFFAKNMHEGKPWLM